MRTWLVYLGSAARRLWRTPRFSISVILIFALVIGANTAIFSIVNTVLLRPLPVENPGRLVQLEAHSTAPEMSSPFPWSYPQFRDYRAATRDAFSAVSIYAPQGFTWQRRGQPVRVRSAVVSGDFFQAMGLRPLLGRTLTAADDSPVSPGANVVLSDSLWRSRFGGRPDVVGQQISLNKRLFTIVGVVRGGSVFAALGSPQLFVPVHAAGAIMSGNSLADRGAGWIQGVYARLRPGASLASVQTVLDFEASRLAHEYPGNDAKLGFHVTALRAGTFGGLLRQDPALTMRVTELLWLAVVLILCVACANILNLFLTRATQRLAEIAVRSVLGASRLRLAMRLLGESLLLCVVGGVVGVVFGLLALRFAERFPAVAGMQPAFDWRVAGYAAVVTVAAALLFGLVPLAAVIGKNLNRSLTGVHSSLSRGQQRQHRLLSIGQIALSMVLLVATGLILHTLIALHHVDLGFDPARTLVAEMDFSTVTGAGFKPPATATLRDLRTKVLALPGVSAVAFADKTPLDGVTMNYNLSVPGFHAPAGLQPNANVATVTAGYLQALGAHLLAGQDFTQVPPDQQDAVLVNQAMARQFWPHENPVGRSFDVSQKTLRIVGVVADMRESSPAAAPAPMFFYRYPGEAGSYLQMLVRTERPPGAEFERTLATTIHNLLPGLPAVQIESMDGRLRDLLLPRTNLLWVLSVFGLMALLITTVGVFSVMYYNVTLRYHEFGMRMALGAGPRDIRRLVLFQVLKLAVIGIAIGFALGIGASHLLRHYVFGVGLVDPASFILVIGVLTAAALLAGAIPAWRASRLEPSEVLREQ
ncbi:MAG: ADOP family duplicated permease [Gammaproteobacteria bacterium]